MAQSDTGSPFGEGQSIQFAQTAHSSKNVALASPDSQRKKSRSALSSYGGTICIIAFLIAVYTLLTDVFAVLDKLLFPGPMAVFAALVDALPRLLESLGSSLALLIPGYALAALSGIGLGIVIALRPKLNKAFRPIIFGLSPVPPSMLVPYLIAVMPTFYLSSTAVIFVGCFWPFLNATISGITLIDQKYLDNAKVLELKGLKRLFFVILPAASPLILAGAGTALTFSFILLTVAEMFATDSGMGYFIQYYADFSDYARVLAGLIFSGAVFVSIMFIYDRLKKKALFWMINEDTQS